MPSNELRRLGEGDLNLEEGTALVLVAHPDDETIWMGGTILQNPYIAWTIFCLCRGDDPDRAPKFRRVLKFLGARGSISNLEDEGMLNIQESVPEIKRRIKKGIKKEHGRGFTYIFTHGYNGEYGHPRHRAVHRAVNQLLTAKQLTTDNIFYFAYKLNEKKGIAAPNQKGALVSKFPARIFTQKQKAIHELYGFSKSSFEYKSCSEFETFSV